MFLHIREHDFTENSKLSPLTISLVPSTSEANLLQLCRGPGRDTSFQSPPDREGFISPAQPSRPPFFPNSFFSGPRPFDPHFHHTNSRARQTTWKPRARLCCSREYLCCGGGHVGCHNPIPLNLLLSAVRLVLRSRDSHGPVESGAGLDRDKRRSSPLPCLDHMR